MYIYIYILFWRAPRCPSALFPGNSSLIRKATRNAKVHVNRSLVFPITAGVGRLDKICFWFQNSMMAHLIRESLSHPAHSCVSTKALSFVFDCHILWRKHCWSKVRIWSPSSTLGKVATIISSKEEVDIPISSKVEVTIPISSKVEEGIPISEFAIGLPKI